MRESEKTPLTSGENQSIDKKKLTTSLIFACFISVVISLLFKIYLDGEIKPPGGSRVALSQCPLSFADWIDHHTEIYQRRLPSSPLKTFDDFVRVGISTFPTSLERKEFGIFWGVLDWYGSRNVCRIQFNGKSWVCKKHGDISSFRMNYSGKILFRLVRGFRQTVNNIKTMLPK